jgi:hypothetical protein
LYAGAAQRFRIIDGGLVWRRLHGATAHDNDSCGGKIQTGQNSIVHKYLLESFWTQERLLPSRHSSASLPTDIHYNGAQEIFCRPDIAAVRRT